MGIKLLLADDSITIQKVVGIIFASDEYELSLVDNGDAALAKAKELVPDVFLVDALMPGKNGYEVCAEVRNDPVLKDVPLLLLTGAFEPFDEEKARRCGADDMITKPFESQQLIDKVETLLQLGRERASAPRVAVAAAPEPEPQPVAPAVVADDSWGATEAAFGSAEPVWSDESVSQGMDIWGDLAAASELPPMPDETAVRFDSDSGFESDIFPTEPAVSAPFEPAVTPAAVEATVEPEPSDVTEPETPPVLETVEALPEDDLWGAFVLEDEVEEPVQFGDVIDTPTEELLGEIEEIEPLMLAEEEEIEEAEPALQAETAGFDSYEQEFTFPDEEPAVPEQLASGDFTFGVEPVAMEEIAPEPVGFAFEEPDTPVVPEVPEEPPALEAPAQLLAPEEVSVPAPVASPAVASSAAEPAISEDQLVAALSRLSRDVIEKIVWEVVPDLAETLIREELRKIREQA